MAPGTTTAPRMQRLPPGITCQVATASAWDAHGCWAKALSVSLTKGWAISHVCFHEVFFVIILCVFWSSGQQLWSLQFVCDFQRKIQKCLYLKKNTRSNHGLLRMIFNIGTWVFFNEISTVCQRGSWSIFWSSGNDMPLVSDRRLRLQPTTALFDISPSMAARSTTAAAPRVRSPQDQTLEGKRELIWVWAKKTL